MSIGATIWIYIMNKEEFIIVRLNLLQDCLDIVDSKGEDYTKGQEDVLSNFKEGEVFKIPAIKVCGVYMKKHIDAIYNYIGTEGQSESEPIEERIKDAINYLTLLYALIKENENNKA